MLRPRKFSLCRDLVKRLLEMLGKSTVVIVDGDLEKYSMRKEAVERHINEARKEAERHKEALHVIPVILPNELEEWIVGAICDEKGVRMLSREKASRILDEFLKKRKGKKRRGVPEGYQKSHLPIYATEVIKNWDRVLKYVPSFKRLIGAIDELVGK